MASQFEVDHFAGGRIAVQLVADRSNVAEWVTNDYAIPVAIKFDREVSNLKPSGPVLGSTVVGAHSVVRVALWEISDSGMSWRERSQLKTQHGDPKAEARHYLYALPFAVGTSHRLRQGFHGASSHTGDDEFAVDFDMPEGTDIRAARDGVIVGYNDKAATHSTDPAFRDRLRANWIDVLHDDGTLGVYWHLEPRGVVVQIGQRVARGDVIARSGFTGFASGPHLHFAIMTAVDGVHARSFVFAFKTRPDDADGETPVEGNTYTAFE